MNILQLIASDNFIAVNKELIKTLGLEEAILIGELASESNYWQQRNETSDGWFYSTIANIEEKTTLSEHKQRKTLNHLKELNIVDIKLKDIPAKRYIKINQEQLIKSFNNNNINYLGCSSLKIKELDTENLRTNNNIINNNIKKEYINKIYSPAEAEQCPDYKEIIDYLNDRTGSSYKYTTNKTKELIKARLNEKFTIDNFKEVIDKKCVEWMNTDMQKYLRPETLFGTKFESYLNQQVVKEKTTKDLHYDFSDF